MSEGHRFNDKYCVTCISKIVVISHHKVGPAENLHNFIIWGAKIVLNEENTVFNSWVRFKKETVVKIAKREIKRT